MSENKRYYRDFEGENGTIIRDRITNEEVFEFGLSDSKDLCDLLNEQDAKIKRLKKENQGLQFKIIDMLDFVKEKGTVTREEIKKWWNGDIDDEKYVQKGGYYHYSINNPLNKYNKPLNCTDWSKKPPYNSTRRNGDSDD